MNVKTMLEQEADRRSELHADHATCRPLSDGYESVGLAGEWEFGKFSGQMPDLSRRPGGDGGVDFRVNLRFTVDVKTARKAIFLLHEQGKVMADIFVLAEHDDATGNTRLVGWEWGAALQRAPVKDLGHGVLSHAIPRENLRPMSELAARMPRN